MCKRPGVQGHHRSYAHRGDFLREIDDVHTLCKRCHKLFHDSAKPETRTRPELSDFVRQPNGGYVKKKR